jgi:hypothetical protein
MRLARLRKVCVQGFTMPYDACFATAPSFSTPAGRTVVVMERMECTTQTHGRLIILPHNLH